MMRFDTLVCLARRSPPPLVSPFSAAFRSSYTISRSYTKITTRNPLLISRSYSVFINTNSIKRLSPGLLPSKRYIQTEPTEPFPPSFNAALMLLGNAGQDLTKEELEDRLTRVLYASGMAPNENEITEFLKQSHRIVKLDDFQIGNVAKLLCIQGGEEQPSEAQLRRVLDVAGLNSEFIDRVMEAGSRQAIGEGTEEGQVAPVKSRWGMAGAIATGGAVLLGKTKYILVALKLTKMTPLISMMITSFAYSFIFGWPYAVGMVGQLLLHESGHAAVMRHYGIPFSPMVFIPFMGAAVSMKDAPRSAFEDAMISFGGPVAGTAAAAVLAVAGGVWGSPMLVALADFGFMINLFNLLPIGQLDGGRIAGVLSPWLNVIGLIGGGAIIYVGAIHNPIFYLIMLAGTYTTVMRFVSPPSASYTTLSQAQRFQVGLGYLALVGFLLWAMRENNKRRLSPKQLQAVKEGRLRTPPQVDPEAFYTDESWDLSVADERQQQRPRWA